MGNSVSKTKSFSVNLRNRINQATATTNHKEGSGSSHSTIVDSNKENSNPVLNKERKPLILQNKSFFYNIKKTAKKKNASNNRQHYQQHTSIKHNTLSRKRPKFKKVVVTKSIIGRPTNFKHLTCPKNMEIEDNNESSVMAAQMIALAALIKPLPDTVDPDKTITAPIIPPRKSSYGNHIYIQQTALSLPLPPTPPSSHRSSLSTTSTQQHHIPSVSMKNKSKSSKNYPSIKKAKKSNIKYASIGKGSITRNQVMAAQHDKMPRQKRKIHSKAKEKAVNSLSL